MCTQVRYWTYDSLKISECWPCCWPPVLSVPEILAEERDRKKWVKSQFSLSSAQHRGNPALFHPWTIHPQSPCYASWYSMTKDGTRVPLAPRNPTLWRGQDRLQAQFLRNWPVRAKEYHQIWMATTSLMHVCLGYAMPDSGVQWWINDGGFNPMGSITKGNNKLHVGNTIFGLRLYGGNYHISWHFY